MLKLIIFNCLSFILNGLVIGFGIAYLLEAKNYIGPRYSPFIDTMWIWCATAVCVHFIAFINICIGSICRKNKVIVSLFSIFLTTLLFGLFFWGCYLHYNLIRYNMEYPLHLWIYFQVIFINNALGVSIFICGICGLAGKKVKDVYVV